MVDLLSDSLTDQRHPDELTVFFGKEVLIL